MLISLLLFLLILSSSVSIMIENKCSTDDDCDFDLICNIQTKTCTCPKTYFWHNDIHACFGCAPGWLDLETKKCLLFAVNHSPGVTWYQAETACNELIAQPLIINNINEFKALQHKIDYLITEVNVLNINLYFHQEWIESYIWCKNNNEKHDCVQIRQNTTTNKICLQYVSCIERANFICEASSVIQSELEKNIAESERSILNDKNMVRLPRQARTQTVAVSATTKKPSSFNFDSISNIINNGLTAAGHISNAIGSYYNSKQQQNSQSNAANPSYIQVDQSLPQALASNNDNSHNYLFYGVLIGGVFLVLFIIIIIVLVRSKKKHVSRTRSSTSSESDASGVSTE